MKFEQWYASAKGILQSVKNFWFLGKKWKVFVAHLLEALDLMYSIATGTFKGSILLENIMVPTKAGRVPFPEWYRTNRGLIYELSRLWFLHKKWKDVFKQILAAFDKATDATDTAGVMSIAQSRVMLKDIEFEAA